MAIHPTTLSESRGEPAGKLASTAMPGIAVTGRGPLLAVCRTRQRLRSWAAKAGALAVPAALTIAASGAAHATAMRQASLAGTHRVQASQGPRQGTGARPAVTTFTWHKLTLLNGWKSSPSPHHSGDPSYAVSAGVVYLSGALDLPTTTCY